MKFAVPAPDRVRERPRSESEGFRPQSSGRGARGAALGAPVEKLGSRRGWISWARSGPRSTDTPSSGGREQRTCRQPGRAICGWFTHVEEFARRESPGKRLKLPRLDKEVRG
ncbi:hypothetical protein NDU88_006107 [Pleurodeles waltl]|uniref:Uncharacterized protein n=1 Tax=Pleurodeles waltl TaxID=8319 RepID=A0AAV7SNT0_PLEWA|nr:hypothetical protein NDU88_006107 [Pleurodeles waltl]